jgi:hypothetical protein
MTLSYFEFGFRLPAPGSVPVPSLWMEAIPIGDAVSSTEISLAMTLEAAEIMARPKTYNAVHRSRRAR